MHAIIGGGLAAARAARTLRELGFDGRLVLFCAEPEVPYERPPLSKGYLAGTESRDDLAALPAGWYDEHDVELRLGTRVTAIDPERHVLTVAGATADTSDPGDTARATYDRLLLATGSTPRRLPIPGAELDQVHDLRRIPDADRLRAALADGGRHVVVVGGGWIGLETAAAARTYGNEVTILERAPAPLYAALGPELGEVFAGLHRDHGVDLRPETGVREFMGTSGRLTSVVTDRGDTLPADVAIVGVGARPAVELAEAAGLEVDDGVVVDAALRTSHPDIFAAGDIARWPSRLLGRQIRVEHWDNARRSGAAAAASMLDQDLGSGGYDPVPYFYTDQYDLGMEFSGLAVPGTYDEVIYRGDLERREFIAFWLSDGRVSAAMNVNVWDVTAPLQRLIRTGVRVDPDRLRDADTPLDQLAPNEVTTS